MTSDIVIRAEKLGKKYMIGHQAERERYTALRDVIARNARNMARSLRNIATGTTHVVGDVTEEFWALKDIDFEIRRGEVVGIIGRNGAGKSTLLKILSRITEPSEGRVEIKGRVASLLEVGTGFHPELSGRENIFLNGAILGMSRAEIKRKFDEIVAFAEVEKFLDTPVKRYSSGMYVRLAFAVAAHLEPEILVVDEVLAVGDAEFQKKCLGKMQEVAGQGRTVLFVSHQMAAVNTLCSRAVWLHQAKIIRDDVPRLIVHEYLKQAHDASSVPVGERTDRGGTGEARLVEMFLNLNSPSLESPELSLEIGLLLSSEATVAIVAIYDSSGILIADFDTRTASNKDEIPARRFKHIACQIDRINLRPGQYYVNVAVLSDHTLVDHVESALRFDVSEYQLNGRLVAPQYRGLIAAPHVWRAIA